MMSEVWQSGIATLLAFAGGAIGVWLGGRIASRRIKELVVGAMGVLVAVTLFDILPEAKEVLSWPVFVLALASGYGLFWLISHKVYHICPACAYTELSESASQQVTISVMLLLTALTIHSLVDGLAVTVGSRIRGEADFGLILGIAVHKFPEGLALSILLLGAGYARARALLATVLVESSTVVGALVGIAALQHVAPAVLGVVFAHIGGGFLYLVVSAASAMHDGTSSPHRLSQARPIAMSGGLAFVLTAGLLSVVRRFVP